MIEIFKRNNLKTKSIKSNFEIKLSKLNNFNIILTNFSFFFFFERPIILILIQPIYIYIYISIIPLLKKCGPLDEK